MKAASTDLVSHIGQETTSLATCWRVVRTDGEEFYFTDHDEDLTVDMADGSGPKVYESSSSYNRSAMTNDNTLSVDNLDLTGVFSSEQITESDLRKGLYDYATVYVFLVNWQDTGQGILRMRKGTLGEVLVTQNGYFQAELRGLAQFYARRIGQTYSAECRADLGDSRCKVPIWPALLGRNDPVALGDFYRVNTLRPDTGELVANGSFDIALGAEWTVLSGAVTRQTVQGALTPYEGTHFISRTGAGGLEIEQVVDFSSLIDTAEVDAGNYYLDFSIARANSESPAFDTGRVVVEILTAADAVLATPLDTGEEIIVPAGVWQTRNINEYLLPATARKIRVYLNGTLVSGVNLNACFDAVHANIRTLNDDLSALYQDKIYEVTTAGTTDDVQPTYDTTIGNPTTDGTAVLTARAARSLDITVTAVDGTLVRKKFTVTDLAPDETFPTGWFAYGAVTWETGANAGKTMEVKVFTGGDASQIIELFLDMPYDIEIGDTGRIFAGCDKRRTTCVTKFNNILNFRGEPYLPGQDQVLKYPT